MATRRGHEQNKISLHVIGVPESGRAAGNASKLNLSSIVDGAMRIGVSRKDISHATKINDALYQLHLEEESVRFSQQVN
jgi:hypothetical protein